MYSLWKEKLLQAMIVTSKSGKSVFYPFGPFKGYLVSKPDYEPIIVRAYAWFVFGGVVNFLIAVFVGRRFDVLLESVMLMLLVDYVLYHFRVRQITKHFVALPWHFSMRVYASLLDPRLMRQQTAFLLFYAAGGVYGLIAHPFSIAAWSVMGLVVMCIVMQSYLLILNHRENSALNDLRLMDVPLSGCQLPESKSEPQERIHLN